MLGYHISLEDIENNNIINGVYNFQLFNSNNKIHSPYIYMNDLEKLYNNKTNLEIIDYCKNSDKKFLRNIAMICDFIISKNVKSLIIHSGYSTKPFSKKEDIREKTYKDIEFNVLYCKLLKKLTNITNIYYLIHLPQTTNYIFIDEMMNLIMNNNNYIIMETENNISFYKNYIIDNLNINIDDLSKNEIIIKCLKELRNKYKFNFCIDTAHIYGAGFDFEENFILDKILKNSIKCIHLNGNELPKGSNKDKHNNISSIPNIINFIIDNNFINIPLILERNRETQEEIKDEINLIQKKINKVNLKNQTKLI